MSDLRVSVCIATFNHEKYIHDCVMSVVMQAREVPLEVLIGDDGSTDRTGTIAKELAERFPECVRYYYHRDKLGAAGNYQFLIGAASGRFVAHLDGDDYWLPGKLKVQVDLLCKCSSLSAVYTNALCIDTKGELIGIFNNRQPERFGLDYLLSGGNFVNHSSLLYRQELATEIVAWKPEFIDYRIHLFLAARGDIGYVNRSGVVYRVNSATSMVSRQGELVRNRYWEAIRDVDATLVSDYVRMAAAADFVRRISFTALRSGAPEVIKHWIPVVVREFPQRRAALAIFIVVRLAVGVWRSMRNRVVSLNAGSNVPIYFWR
jgi:glycosyltransferase involved in cell wall biosynthesis